MNDLISRCDVLSYILYIQNSGLGKKKALEYIYKYVENAIAAYDLDKIVKQLEAIKDAFVEGRQLYGYCIKHGDCGNTHCFGCVLDSVIEIVRKGGV